MTKLFNKLNKSYFWLILSIFEAFFLFFQKFGSLTHNLIWVCNTMPKFRKSLMIQFQENVRKFGRKDVQTLFHRTLSATSRSPTNYISYLRLALIHKWVQWMIYLSSLVKKSLISFCKTYSKFLVYEIAPWYNLYTKQISKI